MRKDNLILKLEHIYGCSFSTNMGEFVSLAQLRLFQRASEIQRIGIPKLPQPRTYFCRIKGAHKLWSSVKFLLWLLFVFPNPKLRESLLVQVTTKTLHVGSLESDFTTAPKWVVSLVFQWPGLDRSSLMSQGQACSESGLSSCISEVRDVFGFKLLAKGNTVRSWVYFQQVRLSEEIVLHRLRRASSRGLLILCDNVLKVSTGAT